MTQHRAEFPVRRGALLAPRGLIVPKFRADIGREPEEPLSRTQDRADVCDECRVTGVHGANAISVPLQKFVAERRIREESHRQSLQWHAAPSLLRVEAKPTQKRANLLEVLIGRRRA
ncbi:MAG: hypothetical protein MZV63_36185 [Marinilabiliales bacterium]|nr:hypothetical protein [Marinilabiliales bacterium]